MLSNASKYAIRAVLLLADKSSTTEKIGAKQIAHELDIPLAFIAKLLQKLVKADIISSSKGPRGGFYLTKKNKAKNVCNIINVIENENIFDTCFMGLVKCDGKNPCPIHHIVAKFKEELLHKFETQTIAEFTADIKREGSYLSLNGLDL